MSGSTNKCYFVALPLELRRKIWGYAMPESTRVFEVSSRAFNESDSYYVQSKGTLQKSLATVNVCRESRAETMRMNVDTGRYEGSDEFTASDIAVMGIDTFEGFQHLWSTGIGKFARLQNLVINELGPVYMLPDGDYRCDWLWAEIWKFQRFPMLKYVAFKVIRIDSPSKARFYNNRYKEYQGGTVIGKSCAAKVLICLQEVVNARRIWGAKLSAIKFRQLPSFL